MFERMWKRNDPPGRDEERELRESNALKLLTLAARAGQDDAERPLPDLQARGSGGSRGWGPPHEGGPQSAGDGSRESLSLSEGESPSIMDSEWSDQESKDDQDNERGLFSSSSDDLKDEIGLSSLRVGDSRPSATGSESESDLLRSASSGRGQEAVTTERPRSPEGGQAPPAGTWERGDDSGGLSEGAESRFSTDKSESEDNWSTSSNDSDEEAACHPSPGEIIGRGAFGSVYKTTWKGVPAALKVLEHDDELGQSDGDGEEEFDDSEGEEGGSRRPGTQQGGAAGSNSAAGTATQADLALIEAAMCSAVHHPNVVQTFHYRTLQPSQGAGTGLGRAVRETHIVMEFCDCGSLEDATTDGRLADASGADVDLELLCITLLEVCRAMEYLHKMHITHRDLKLANVLLKSDPADVRRFTTKVSDFGLSRLLPDHSPKLGSQGEYTGTITHMAPELLEHGGMSRAADVYSFGILMWEALMGEPAYQGISKMQVMFGVVSEGLRPVFPPNTPPWYAQIAEVCWRREPKRRPTFTRVAQMLEDALLELRVTR